MNGVDATVGRVDDAKPTVLEVKGLKVSLGQKDTAVRAVDEIDLTIRSGETFALLGESGCGKSITALSIMRLLPPGGRVVAGDVLLDGVSLLDLSESRMRRERGGRVGMIFQEPMTSLNPVMSIGKQIGEAVVLHDGEQRHRVRQRCTELLKAVGIPDPERRIDEYPHQLSGGMKQRVMIAMALAGRPMLLIADEPTTSLDVTIQAQVLELLKELQRQSAMAVLLITHDLGVVAEVADRVAVMYAGQIVETAAVAHLFSAPSHPYTRKLFRALPNAGKRAARLDVIPGMVPPLDRVFVGCRFAERCAGARALCREALPPWRHRDGTSFRCHFEPNEVLLLEHTLGDHDKYGVQANGNDGALLSSSGLKVHFPIQKGVLRRTVGWVKAVDGVDMAIQAGRTLALVGESGCGKTTVGKALLQLIRPTSGSVRFDGEELTGLRSRVMRKRRRELQIIFQDPAASMNPRMLVGDIVTEGLSAQGIETNRKRLRGEAERLLEQVGLAKTAVDRYPHEFSGGQRQRICVARALALRPRLIVCDEPTSALDVSVQAQVLNLLRGLQGELRLAYLFITHNLSVVSYIAHDVAVMYLGRIVEYGSVAEVLESPAHPYTQALLSAIPAFEPGLDKVVMRLAGDLPSPANPPSGCHFHPRCPKATDKCRTVYPETVRLGVTHRVSCVLYPSE